MIAAGHMQRLLMTIEVSYLSSLNGKRSGARNRKNVPNLRGIVGSELPGEEEAIFRKLGVSFSETR